METIILSLKGISVILIALFSLSCMFCAGACKDYQKNDWECFKKDRLFLYIMAKIGRLLIFILILSFLMCCGFILEKSMKGG
jgi:hypothetical protein